MKKSLQGKKGRYSVLGVMEDEGLVAHFEEILSSLKWQGIP